MKQYIYIFTLAMLSMAASCKQGTKKDDNNKAENAGNNGTTNSGNDDRISYRFDKAKPYPYETGIIEYKYTGDIQGKQTVYFKDFGRVLSVEEEYVNASAPTQPRVKQMFINTPDKYYFVDIIAKQGYVAKRNDSTAKEQTNLLADVTTYGIDSAMNKNGYKPSGQVEISGKKCQVYKSESGESEFCFWQGMNIRTQMSLGKNVKYKLEAIKISENAKVDDDKFTPPADIKMLDYSKYIKAQTKDKL